MVEFRSSSTERIRELCRRLKPILGARADQLFFAYLADSVDGKKQIEQYLEVLAAKHFSVGAEAGVNQLVPPTLDKLHGSYALGTAMFAGKSYGTFGLRESEWIQHVGIFGRSGAGKTNLGFQVFRQLLEHGKPVLVFDWKRNYRDLLQLPEFKNVQIYTAGRKVAPFRFNPLIPPPNTDSKTWLKQIIEVVAHAYCLGNGVLFLLQESVDAVYRDAGVYEGRVPRWPTFRDVLEKARDRNARGRESAWLSSTLRALSSLTFGEMDTLLNTTEEQSQRLKDLLREAVVIEMDALGQADKTFLISSLLLYIHHLRMAEGEREVFKHAILIEEAHHVLTNERQSLLGGQSVMEITFREIREFGEAVIILDQHPSKITLSALGNTYCTICFNLKHQKDVSAMAQSMLLEGSDKDILGSLGVGDAVVKLQGRAPQPFLISVPEFEVSKGSISDADVRMRMSSKIGKFVNAMPVRNLPSLGLTDTPTSIPSQDDAARIRFLRDIVENPESGVAARYKRIGLSVRQGQRLKGKLVLLGMLDEREERTATGRLHIIRLTEKGRVELESVT